MLATCNAHRAHRHGSESPGWRVDGGTTSPWTAAPRMVWYVMVRYDIGMAMGGGGSFVHVHAALRAPYQAFTQYTLG